MPFLGLAIDYDGTLALGGRVEAATIAALRRLRSTGRRLIMVTGRWLDDLRQVFDAVDLFDAVVVENGSIVFLSDAARTLLVGEAPPPTLVQALRGRGVHPLSVGRGVVSTLESHQAAVLDAIRELDLHWQVVLNKGAVMVLPTGVDKAAGLKIALAEFGLSPLDVVGIGDAENDQAFLSICGCSVAVANALPAVKAAADIVTKADNGAGVRELIEGWLDEGDKFFGDLT